MDDKLQQLTKSARSALELGTDPEAVRVKYLGKKGELSQILAGLGKLAPDERRAVGERANQVKAELEQLISQALARAEEAKFEQEAKGSRVDVTLPGRGLLPGHRHPVSRTLDEIVRIFRSMGFDVADGPEVELDYYNFEALNMPPEHPARDMQDTFFVDASWLVSKKPPVVLRTHTSPVQIRAMLAKKPPIRVVIPGRVYRRDSDLTHTPMFHQMECLVVDRGVTFAELKGTLNAFVSAFFGPSTRTRFRPSFFPFTEPSAEVDITCTKCEGKGCRVCKQTGWLEILGAGMVHPNVFKSAGYDPSQVSGFAFGTGIERPAMMRYRIDDLRMMFENDVRFLEQF